MKRCSFLLLALSILLLAGCSLARAEDTGAAGQRDRWVGFYAVYEGSWPGSSGDRQDFDKNPHLVEYGASPYETDQFGTITLTSRVLFAEKTEDGYVFPDFPGYQLFLLTETMEDGDLCTSCVSDMGPGEEGFVINVTDSGTENRISGSLYLGPPAGAEDWDPYENRGVWTAYRVFQTPDGRLYLNGSGNSYAGGGSSFTETQTYAYAQDGETVKEDQLTAKVFIKVVPRLEKLTVTQFDANNTPIRSDELALREDMPELVCEPDAVWALVEEANTDGVVHTAYDLPAEDGDPVSHMVVLLDEDGMGTAVQLEIRAAGAA